MSLKDKLQMAWKNKGQIMEGFYNAYVGSSDEVKQEALRRLELCRTNKCGFHDPKGESERAVFKGKESCGGCGCDLYAKAHAMSAHCFLKDVQIQMFRTMLLNGQLTDTGLTEEQLELVKVYTDDKIWEIIGQVKESDVALDLGTDPLWDSVMTVEQDIEINKITYKRQFEDRK